MLKIFQINVVLSKFELNEESWKNIIKVYTKIKQRNSFQKRVWTANQHIRMISEGSCDTEDWSNGCCKFSFAITGVNNIFK